MTLSEDGLKCHRDSDDTEKGSASKHDAARPYARRAIIKPHCLIDNRVDNVVGSVPVLGSTAAIIYHRHSLLAQRP
jgi:hypothetical protein